MNQDGKISVGSGVDAAKRSAIEKVLNEDKTLWRDIVTAYGFRKAADAGRLDGISSGAADTRVSLEKVTRAIHKHDIDTILQREFGTSLDEIESDSGLMKHFYEEELALYTAVLAAKKSPNDDSFTVEFAYKNGVTIQKGTNDQTALDKMPKDFAKNAVRFPARELKDYAVTIDSAGMILDAEVRDVEVPALSAVLPGLTDYIYNADGWVTERLKNINRDSVTNDGGLNHLTPISNQQVLQQYVTDMQRLMLFNNADLKAEDVKDLQVTFGKTDGKSFTVAAANTKNLPPFQLAVNNSGMSFSVRV